MSRDETRAVIPFEISARRAYGGADRRKEKEKRIAPNQKLNFTKPRYFGTRLVQRATKRASPVFPRIGKRPRVLRTAIRKLKRDASKEVRLASRTRRQVERRRSAKVDGQVGSGVCCCREPGNNGSCRSAVGVSEIKRNPPLPSPRPSSADKKPTRGAIQ